jgi:hypothetical protein
MASLVYVDGPLIGVIQSGPAPELIQANKVYIELEPGPNYVLRKVQRELSANYFRYAWSVDHRLYFYSCDQDYVRRYLLNEHPSPRKP